MKLNDLILLEGTLSQKDKAVIFAFLKKEKASSKKLDSDGITLDGLWMGGKNIASWKNKKIKLGKLDSPAKNRIQKIIRSQVGTGLLTESIIFETATAGMTSVASIGSLETQAFPALIKLFKRDDKNVPKCVGKICRKKGKGWRMVFTDEWQNMNLPHFGNLVGAKSPKNGKKTITSNLSSILQQWGINLKDIKTFNQ